MSITHTPTLAHVPILRYTLAQTIRGSDETQQISFVGQLVGMSRSVDLHRAKGTMVSIFKTRPMGKIIVAVHQWQRSSEDIPTTARTPFIMKESDWNGDTTSFEHVLQDELEDFFLGEEGKEGKVPIVIERPVPFRKRAYQLSAFLSILFQRNVGYLPVHVWEQWNQDVSNTVVHIVDTHPHPPFYLTSMTRHPPLLSVMSPDLWNKIRVWDPELGAKIRTFPTPALDPRDEVIAPRMNTLYDHLLTEAGPYTRIQTKVRSFDFPNQAFGWLWAQGKGRLGAASEEAWSEAQHHVPDFRKVTLR